MGCNQVENMSVPAPPPPTENTMSGDRAAMADAFSTYYGLLKGFFTRHKLPREDAEDCVSEVYARLLALNARRPGIESWRSALLCVANSVMVDRHRRDAVRQRGHHVPIDDDLAETADPQAVTPEMQTAQREELREVWRILERLDPDCRNAFLMARVEGYAHKEIARRLEISTVAVGRHIERALYELARHAGNF
ncbi:MAG: RNA polymerase sigma factor [Telmatospirillum sp.]|nr:RNA polymerase sigma factor [Telmatospirillum sp.]